MANSSRIASRCVLLVNPRSHRPNRYWFAASIHTSPTPWKPPRPDSACRLLQCNPDIARSTPRLAVDLPAGGFEAASRTPRLASYSLRPKASPMPNRRHHRQWRQNMAVAEQIERETEIGGPDWGPDAPKGARAVMNRVLKENATVPLFFAQTLIQSLRDVGYNHTTSALCEHIDNAIQADANEIRVFFRQLGKRGQYEIDAGVYDNGKGMQPNVLKVAMAFGGSMSYGNRRGIARFGMGMKTAALSMSPVLDVYSWQEPRAIYNMTLDVEAIGRE